MSLNRQGLALGAYLAQAGLDAAELRAVPGGTVQQGALAELIRAAGLVRTVGGEPEPGGGH